MAATTLFLWLGRSQVGPAYKTALTISGLVFVIAAYHYFRIFESWEGAYVVEDGMVAASKYAFNDAYRYVDWLLTVPLLLVELILVMRLSDEETVSKSFKLGGAAALMIALGYPGEIATDIPTSFLLGTLSAIPFVYIMWQLFAGLGASINSQPENVRELVKKARFADLCFVGLLPDRVHDPVYELKRLQCYGRCPGRLYDR